MSYESESSQLEKSESSTTLVSAVHRPDTPGWCVWVTACPVPSPIPDRSQTGPSQLTSALPLAGDDPTTRLAGDEHDVRAPSLLPSDEADCSSGGRREGKGRWAARYLWEGLAVTLFRRTLSTPNVIYSTTERYATANVFRPPQLILTTKTCGTSGGRLPVGLKFPCLIRYAARSWPGSRGSELFPTGKHLKHSFDFPVGRGALAFGTLIRLNSQDFFLVSNATRAQK